MRKARLAIFPHEGGDTTAYATQQVLDALKNVSVYWFSEDAFGDLVAYEIDVAAWSDLPAKGKKAIKESGE